ncbi:MAG TPA: MlaD family protein [Bacteroidales bacterium]|nr:MlaD family protein [Bacteroidales bacterium]HRW94760.1 MlaD family protein [Bacteroidales bacterium]
MKTKKMSRELKIGLFALVVIVVLYFVVQFLKGNDLFRGTNTFYAIYPNVEGLAPTSPVSVLGLTAGTVDRIDFDQKNQQMIIKIRLKKKFKLPEGTTAEIYSADILGGKAVQLVLGNSSAWHSPGDTLTSSIQPDLISLLTKELVSLKDDISGLTSNLNLTVTRINDILDEENRNNIKNGLTRLNASLGHINRLTETLGNNASRIDGILAGADTLAGELNLAVKNLSGTLANFDDVSEELKEADLGGTVEELHKLLENLSDPEGTLGQIGSNPALYHSLTDILSRADSLIRLISENPKKYLRITVF